jgi:hypothetical protein
VKALAFSHNKQTNAATRIPSLRLTRLIRFTITHITKYASVIATDAYVPNEQTSNGEADGIEGEDKIKMTKARSNNRAANGSCNVPACQVSPRRNRKEKAHVFTT